jgi:hypothetical protein
MWIKKDGARQRLFFGQGCIGPTGSIDRSMRMVRHPLMVPPLHFHSGQGDKVTANVRKLTAAIKQETAARDVGFAKIDNKLKETLVGDWQFAFVGLVYLFVGIILGTVPEEIARLMLCLGFS